MRKINYPAVRAFIRAMEPTEESYALSAYYDSKFDGGEYSGPALQKWYEEEFDKMSAKIADRFDMNSETLASDYEAYWYEQEVCETNAAGLMCGL